MFVWLLLHALSVDDFIIVSNWVKSIFTISWAKKTTIQKQTNTLKFYTNFDINGST